MHVPRGDRPHLELVRGPERRDVSSLNALTIVLQNLDGAFSNRVEADGKLTRDDIACN